MRRRRTSRATPIGLAGSLVFALGACEPLEATHDATPRDAATAATDAPTRREADAPDAADTLDAPDAADVLGPPDTTDAPSASPRAVWLAFAADFATGGVCGDEPTGAVGAIGCDIYRARLDPDTWQPLVVERLTRDPVPEVFPSVAAGGARVYFHAMSSATARSVGVFDVATGARSIVAEGAQYPSVMPDGRALAFTDVTAGYALTLGALDDGGARVTARTILTTSRPAQDPDASRDGRRVLYHVTGSGPAHGVFLVDTTTRAVTTVTQSSGAGHCALSPSGARVVCDDATGHGLAAWQVAGSQVTGPSTLVADPVGLGATDPDYASCGVTSVDFPSFCDETHLAVSVSCVAPREGIRFSKVFLADLGAGPTALHPLGGALAARFGGPGHTSWTPSCRTDE